MSNTAIEALQAKENTKNEIFTLALKNNNMIKDMNETLINEVIKYFGGPGTGTGTDGNSGNGGTGTDGGSSKKTKRRRIRQSKSNKRKSNKR